MTERSSNYHRRKYKKIPKHHKDDNVFPSVSEIPSILTSMRHPRRRAVSIGPQSEADAYETLAYREKRRRDSISSARALSPTRPRIDLSENAHNGSINIAGLRSSDDPSAPASSTKTSRLNEFEHMMGTGSDDYNRMSPAAGEGADLVLSRVATGDQSLQDRDEKDMFSKLQKPRVRYDVEVVTKLIVYSGMQVPCVDVFLF